MSHEGELKVGVALRIEQREDRKGVFLLPTARVGDKSANST